MNSDYERIEKIAKKMNLKKGQIIVLRNEKGKIVEAIIKTLILLLASTFICWQVWEIRTVADSIMAQQNNLIIEECQKLQNK